MENTSAKLTIKQKMGFGICDMGGNLFFTLMGFWSLYFLTDVVGILAAWAGIAVMVGKIWDAVTDPMMGFISDRTLSRWGRRRPYLLFGSIPLLLSMWLFFTAPNIQSPVLLVLWAGFTLMLLNTAMTVINIPYGSLTPELTTDYHERTSLNGYRFACAVVGTMLGAAVVQPLVNFFGSLKGAAPVATAEAIETAAEVVNTVSTPSIRFGWSMTGLFMGAVVAITTLLTFFGVKEKKYTKADLPTKKFFQTYKAVFLNGPFVKLLFTYGLNIMGLTFLQTILAYYTEYVYKKPEMTMLAMVILLVTAMICIPISVVISKKIGKKRTYQICFVALASACMVIYFLAQKLGPNFFLGMMVWAGIGVGFVYVAPFAMIPDAIDYGAAKSGERDEGAYYGIWTFVSKMGTSFSVFASGLILQWGGYIAKAEQSKSAIRAIHLLIGPIPALVLIGAFLIVERYPIDEKTYMQIKNNK